MSSTHFSNGARTFIFERRATIGGSAPIRSAPRLSSDALITGAVGENSARQHRHDGLYRGNNNLRHRCRQARPVPLNPRERAHRKRVAGRNVSEAAARYRVSRDAISPFYSAFSESIFSAGNFNAG